MERGEGCAVILSLFCLGLPQELLLSFQETTGESLDLLAPSLFTTKKPGGFFVLFGALHPLFSFLFPSNMAGGWACGYTRKDSDPTFGLVGQCSYFELLSYDSVHVLTCGWLSWAVREPNVWLRQEMPLPPIKSPQKLLMEDLILELVVSVDKRGPSLSVFSSQKWA